MNAPTKCLEEAIRAHEQVHQDACRDSYDKHHIIFRRKAMDRFEAMGMTMAGYIMEEVTGYQAELKFLRKELARLEPICQPPGRDYSSRGYAPDEDHGTSPSPAPTPSRNDDPTKPKPLAKPKPLPTPKPIY